MARADATFTIWFRDCSFAGVVAVEGDEWSWWPSSGFGSFASGTRADIASAIHLAISAAECDFLMGLRPNPPRYGALINGTPVPQR